MKKIFLILALIGFLFIIPNPVFAIYDPTSVPNNTFGIHIADIGDLDEAAALVNSSGGKWGYVTFVIQKGDRDLDRWRAIFERVRELKVIPIVRVATRPILVGWEKPSVDEIDGWVSFLDSLPWPTKDRYVIIGNEPNHAKEWGGFISPEEYANYLKFFSSKLKAQSDKFFVLPAGLDASTPNSFFTMDEELFIRRMIISEPKIFNFVDGWVSHSYPNPKFSGSEYSEGRETIKTFKWEEELLKNLGIETNFPIFITETGWINTLGEKALSQKFKYAFQNVWTGSNIVAITPFILNYKEAPFDIFSWRGRDNEYFNFYYTIRDLPKKVGNPILEPPLTPPPTLTPRPTMTAVPTPVPEKSIFEKILLIFGRRVLGINTFRA